MGAFSLVLPFFLYKGVCLLAGLRVLQSVMRCAHHTMWVTNIYCIVDILHPLTPSFPAHLK